MKFATAGVGWKEAATGLVTTIKAEDFTEVVWMRLMKGYRVRLVLVNGAWFEFDGFKEDDLVQYIIIHFICYICSDKSEIIY